MRLKQSQAWRWSKLTLVITMVPSLLCIKICVKGKHKIMLWNGYKKDLTVENVLSHVFKSNIVLQMTLNLNYRDYFNVLKSTLKTNTFTTTLLTCCQDDPQFPSVFRNWRQISEEETRHGFRWDRENEKNRN